jgi:putative redox protein
MTEGTAVIRATHEGGDRLLVAVRGHHMFSDQPVEDGGGDTAPTPTEMFIAGLAGCVAFYAERFLRRHGLGTDGLEVSCSYRWAANPHRIGDIDVKVVAPSLTDEKRKAFGAVIEHCTLHHTLQQPPAVRIHLAHRAAAA